MKILSARQVKDWDNYTIRHEPVSSIDLMERAAKACVQWLLAKNFENRKYLIFCGKGNNGGDGLAIARLLLNRGVPVVVYILDLGNLGSPDFQHNLQQQHHLPNATIYFIQSSDHFPAIESKSIIIDALFGLGLNKPLEALAALLVKHSNASGALTIAIDLPSGLFVEKSSLGHTVIQATYTLTFQCFKRGLLLQENASFIGTVVVLDIGLHQGFLADDLNTPELVEEGKVRKIFRPRNRFSHKGTFGHALLIGGSFGKIGAMVMATKACLHTGNGLTTVFLPGCGYHVMQVSAPEAMTITDEDDNFLSSLPGDIEKFNAIGVGPGMDTKEGPQKVVSFIVRRYQKPLVIDADGLNCLALDKQLLAHLPPYSILTPHPKEFDRLFGEQPNDFERLDKAKQKAQELKVVIVLKSHHTIIALPDGKVYFNSTGNAGMAKGGSGDVLTGIITSLLAQGYSSENAAVMGVYIHGWAGDMAAATFSYQAMLPSHLIEFLPYVFLSLEQTNPTTT